METLNMMYIKSVPNSKDIVLISKDEYDNILKTHYVDNKIAFAYNMASLISRPNKICLVYMTNDIKSKNKSYIFADFVVKIEDTNDYAIENYFGSYIAYSYKDYRQSKPNLCHEMSLLFKSKSEYVKWLLSL